MRNTNKLVQGVGTKGMVYPSCENNKKLREYTAWCGMLERCTGKCWVKNPSYTGTTCSEYFKYYPNFYEWCNSQTGFRGKDENGKSWHLDKDLLVKGNKIYSEDTCVFIPNKINCLFVNCGRVKGKFMAGVSFDDKANKFISQCSNGNGKPEKLGTFKTEIEAFQAYKVFKEARVKRVTEEFKGRIDNRAYEALLSWEVVENTQTVIGE